jgi:dihydrofolate synthase/folylpolyglutamate synthase
MVSDAKEAPMSLTYSEALTWLDQCVNFERRAGPAYTADVYRLDRFSHLLAELGDPQDRTPAVIVAGTKGKGSTAALIEAGARAAGCRTGFYSSPHLNTFRERIRVEGALITEEALAALVETRLRPVVDGLMATGAPALEPTYFELITALGFLTFAEQGVDLAVLEVGLGGRLDPTNVVTPLLSVITPISYDHMAVLGDTLAQIAFEKAGIIKPRGVALSALQPAEAAGVIAQVAIERGATLYHPADLLPLDPASLAVQRDATGLPLGRTLALLPLGADGTPAGVPFHLPLPLLGRHQVGNAQVAAAALLLLRRNGPDALRRGSLADLGRALAQGFATVDWPGRLEIVDSAPLTVLDGAHNGESAQRLREALEEDFGVTGRQVVIVMGVNRGHSVDDIVRELAPIAAHVVLTPLHSPRSTPPAELATAWAPYAVPVSLTADVPAALQAAAQLAIAEDARLICVTGSLYLVGEAREAFGRSYGHDPA